MATSGKATKTPKYSKLDPVHINIGLQVLYPNQDEPASSKSSKITLDIVAIPGLGANPEWVSPDFIMETFCAYQPDVSAPGAQVSHSLAPTWVRDKVHWLRDSNMLARRIPNARISVFQYQSQWFGKGSVDQRLENVADQLLYQLERSRGEHTKTPIIFVSHCLGGIVLERALLTARLRQNDFPSVFPWVAGCIFLGTPFHGTKTQSKAMVLAEMAETIGMGVPSSLLKLLEKDSEILNRMLDEFVRLSNDAQIRVFCFFESQKSDVAALLLKGLPFKSQELIVDKESATFPGVESLQLASDHFSLNKYTGPKDGNFVTVSSEIKATAAKAAIIIKSRQNAVRQALINDRTYHALIDHLGKGFSDLDATVKGSYKGPKGNKTSWVLDVDSFKKWKEQQTPHLLWIHGKAGTGQGSIASSVIESLNGSKEQGSIVASFFCDQSDENRRSLRGILRILIRQIIDLNQDLAVHLLTDSKKTKGAGRQDFDPESLSKVSVLWEALQTMAKDLTGGCIYVILYGIDQLSKESLGALLENMSEAPARDSIVDDDSEISPIKWMLLSRSGRPDIEKTLKPRAYEINIDDSENSEHVSDALRADISARVDELELPAPLSYFVKRHIHSRAEENYIYVSLVIQELKNFRASGSRTHSEVRQLLESFPYGLTEMFEHIQKRILKPGTDGIELTKEILRCLILNQRAPTMRELAVMTDLPREDRNDLEKLKEYIIRCGAFITLRGNELDENSMTVEWIDPSAQDHLEKFAKDELALELKDMQHGIIALRCLEYVYEVTERYGATKPADHGAETDELPDDEKQDNSQIESDERHDEKLHANDPVENNDRVDEEQDHDKDKDDDKPDTEAGSEIMDGEFDERDALQYPVQYWLAHAKLAPVDVIEEFRLEHSFWDDESPARQDWWSQNDSIHVLANQTNVTPLHVATIAEFPAFVDHLLSHRSTEDVHKEDSMGFQPLFYACAVGNFEIVQTLLGVGADLNFVSDEGKISALYAAAEKGHLEIVESLLDRDAEINSNCEEWGSPLYVACEQNQEAVIRLLLDRGAKPNLVGGSARRAINIATWTGNTEVVRLLVDAGAEVDPDDEYMYGSAVGTASRRGHVEIVKLLLSKGWSPSKPMKTYGSFLTCAATYGHVGVVELLVQKEARVTVLEQALAAASQHGKSAVVKIILDSTPSLRHQKAFMLAADYGRDEVLKLIFPRGITQEELDQALYLSADHEHESTVKLLLEFGADPNAEGPTYGCALTAACYDGTEEIVKALLSKGADPNKQGGDYGNPLQAAAWFGDAEIVKMLLDSGALVNTDPIGIYGNPLQAAAECGDPDTLRLLLENGAQVDAQGGKYGYAIIAAVDQGDSETLKILLEHHANVLVSGGEDNQPLISLAGCTLAKDDLELILDHGADINAVCNRGTTALINCADAGDCEGLEFLLSRGAAIEMSSEAYGTALIAAAMNGDKESCEVLLKASADPNAIGGPYGHALQAACTVPDLDTVQVLLDAGADPTGLETVAGEFGTAIQAACASGDIEIVRLLIELGAVIDLQPANGKYGYALHAAAQAGHEDIVELLLDHDADVNVEGGIHGYAIIGAASQPYNDAVIRLLIDHGALVSVQGGLYGSAVAAAAFTGDAGLLELLLEHGADARATGGKYGSPLVCAAIKSPDTNCADLLLDHNVEVNYQGGKYHTALIAAAYFDRLDLVSKLIDKGADIKLHGGKFMSAVSAAAMRGNKAILEKLLKMEPPEQLLDEALVVACAHRQASSVEMLLKSGANVLVEHPTLGTAIDALKADQTDGYNSDNEFDGGAESDDDSDDEDDDDESDDEWEGDGESVAGSEQGSVLDLQLEDEVTEEIKIQKLLDEAIARVKRNPTVTRFKTIKRRELPASLTAGTAPQLTPRTSYQGFNAPQVGGQYGQQPDQQLPNPSRESFQAYSQPAQQAGKYPTQGYPPSSTAGYPASTSGQPTQIGRKPVPSGYVQSTSQNTAASGAQTSSLSGPPTGNYPPLPPRVGSQEHASHRYSMPVREPQLNPGSSGRYQQQQQQQLPPPLHGRNTSPTQNPYASPPQPSYHSPPMYNSPPPPQHFDPLAQQQSHYPSQYQPFTSPPPGQETGYIPYGQQSHSSSQTSIQSSHYANSTQYAGSQSGSYQTQNSSQTSGFSLQGQGQGNKWTSAGYSGEGYG